MDLIIGEHASEYDEYEELLLERDRLLKEADEIWSEYLRAFGDLINSGYEVKLECVMCKKKIAYYQAAKNRGGIVDPEALREYLEKEAAVFQANLKRMISETENSKKTRLVSAYEMERAKTLYRRLAKRIHPDIFPETAENETLQKLWGRITAAYRCCDVKALAELEVLVQRTMASLGMDAVKVEVPDLSDRIEEVKQEIFDITSAEPYTFRTLLDDEEAVEKKKAELQKELEQYSRYRSELEAVISDMERNGGLRFVWLMN